MADLDFDLRATKVTIRGAAKLAAALLAASIGWVGAAAFAATPLLALSDKDMAATHESGCNFLFDTGRQTRVFAIGNELMIRTASGLSLCRLGERPIDDFIEGNRALACGGRTLRVTRVGKLAGHEESDSADWPATLTIRQGSSRQTLRGTAGTAC